MRKGRESKEPDRSATSWLPEVDASYRDDVDPDPLVEAMVERLRSSLSGLVALDEYGRPVAWRAVVRIALGPTLGRLRDAQTALALMDHAQGSADGRAGLSLQQQVPVPTAATSPLAASAPTQPLPPTDPLSAPGGSPTWTADSHLDEPAPPPSTTGWS